MSLILVFSYSFTNTADENSDKVKDDIKTACSLYSEPHTYYIEYLNKLQFFKKELISKNTHNSNCRQIRRNDVVRINKSGSGILW